MESAQEQVERMLKDPKFQPRKDVSVRTRLHVKPQGSLALRQWQQTPDDEEATGKPQAMLFTDPDWKGGTE